MLRGSTNKGDSLQSKSFKDGWLFQLLTKDYRQELKVKAEAEEGDGHLIAGLETETVLRLDLKDVAVRRCLNPDCAGRKELHPAEDKVCPMCFIPFKEIFFKSPGILVLEEGWHFHEEENFYKCCVKTVFDDPLALEKIQKEGAEGLLKMKILDYLKELLKMKKVADRWCGGSGIANELKLDTLVLVPFLDALLRDGHIESKEGEKSRAGEIGETKYKLFNSDHYFRTKIDCGFKRVLTVLKAGRLSLDDLVARVELPLAETQTIVDSLRRQSLVRIVKIRGSASSPQYGLNSRGRMVHPRLFLPYCPLHLNSKKFSQRPTKLWVQRLDGGGPVLVAFPNLRPGTHPGSSHDDERSR